MAHKIEQPYDRDNAPVMVRLNDPLQGRTVLVPQWIAPTAVEVPEGWVDGGYDASWSPCGRFLATAGAMDGPGGEGFYVNVYAVRSDGSLTFVTNLNVENDAYGVAWSSDGKYLSVAFSSSPYIATYVRDGYTFTRMSSPASLPSSVGLCVAWMGNRHLAYGANFGSTPLYIYQRVINSFNLLSQPAAISQPAGQVRGLEYSPSGRFLAVAHSSSPYVTIYERTGTTYTKLSNPATLPTGSGYDVAWSPDERFLAVAHDLSPGITIYERNGTTFTKLANPSTIASWAQGVAWSPDGRNLIISCSVAGTMVIYSRSGTTFTALSNPSQLPYGSAYSSSKPSWSPDGKRVFLQTYSPFRGGTLYTTTGTPLPGIPSPITPYDGYY